MTVVQKLEERKVYTNGGHASSEDKNAYTTVMQIADK
jgi:hypothetical protein